ncbi:Hypothetical predicted protein [Olea europaea subsp. europaea]|uniref:Uncharacterized protein n=1 Tax=Olea europaea subsp. europaea TaxID=158383 RepID=A0A8S0VDH5_OLEEU|nr:Hypothetical predicted protein [Olea europaea subsp. europaea]
MPPLHRPSPPVPPLSSIPRHNHQQHHHLTPPSPAAATTIYAITIVIYTATTTICRASNDLGRCWHNLQSRNASLTALTTKMVERWSLMATLSDDECKEDCIEHGEENENKEKKGKKKMN